MHAEIPLEFEPVNTSCGATGMAYVEESKEMFLVFASGTWRYPDVSHSEYMTLRNAGSFGKQWNTMKRERGKGWGVKVA